MGVIGPGRAPRAVRHLGELPGTVRSAVVRELDRLIAVDDLRHAAQAVDRVVARLVSEFPLHR